MNPSLPSFPSSAWERTFQKLRFLCPHDSVAGKQSFTADVPKRSLGTRQTASQKSPQPRKERTP
jgi:hypothetical protein